MGLSHFEVGMVNFSKQGYCRFLSSSTTRTLDQAWALTGLEGGLQAGRWVAWVQLAWNDRLPS